MMIETVLARSLRLMFSGSAAVGLSLFALQAMAQQAAEAPMQRVEITGSSIKRITAEGALPVQTLTHAQIQQSGATNVADLIATLPSMQGFTTSSMSVNGGGGGLQSASIHSIGEGYTLVLLNGRRLAPSNSGGTVNLASIPLAAVERIEILTDGANTLYGSDAIAGVVNFILKKNQTDLTVEASYSNPHQSSSGSTTNVSLTKGFGDLDKDGYNILVSVAHDESKKLLATERDFSKSGVIRFKEKGKTYELNQLSGNSIPGNATVKYLDAKGVPSSAAFGPNYLATGKCNGPNLVNAGNRCLYDYAAAVEDVPALKRDSFFGSLNIKFGEQLFFAEAVSSKFTNTAAYAPPAQPLGIPLGGVVYTKSIAPYLARLGIDPAKVTSAAMNLRLADAGQRTDDYATSAKHLAFGLEGALAGWDYSTAFVHSENTATDRAAGGYMSLNAFDALVNTGKFDPFAPPGNSQAILAPAVLTHILSETVSKINSVSLRGSRELFKLPAGPLQVGIGADATRQQYVFSPDAYSQGQNKQQPNFTDAIVGGGAGALPVDASRKSWGAYAEFLIPVIKNLDVTASSRYDSYNAVKNDKNFNTAGDLIAPGTQGNDASKATYKLSLRYSPTDTLLLRGSYGTGFRVADMTDIVDPLQNNGSSAFHACPIKSSSDPRFPLCNPGSSEYNLMKGGNPYTGKAGLRPEESKQATIGFRIEPFANLSLGFDLWDVKLENQIQTLSEDTVFGNPAKYSDLLVSYFDPIQKQNVLAAALSPFNLASSRFRGIDWDHTYKANTAFGKLNLNWTGTYMLVSEQDLPDDAGKAITEKNIGLFNSYSEVTFRLITKATASLRTSDTFTHSLTGNYHSGYTDAVYTEENSVVNEIGANGATVAFGVPMTRKVKSYTTFDWQTKFAITKALILTGGIKNLLDEDPPFTIRNAGGGNQSGYDGRYTDPLGRQFYLSLSYKY